MLIRSHLLLPAAVLATSAMAAEPQPLAEAKLIIEHNATDLDTGFQGFIDGEGWSSMVVAGPAGEVFRFQSSAGQNGLGLTELFFETVEPLNADVPLAEVLSRLPEGPYNFHGVTLEGGEITAQAVLSHAIPAGPVLVSPADDAVVPADALVVAWEPVTQTIRGEPIELVAYQLVVENSQKPHPRMIGSFGLSMYLPPSVTEISLPAGLLEPGTRYDWEVLAIAGNGNQTLSAAAFSTR